MSPVLHAFIAQTASDAQPSSPFGALGGFMPIILIGLVFYFLMIRPQSKQAKQHQAFIGALKKGDEVVTQGGIIGTIVAVEDRTVTVDAGGGTKLRILKNQVTGQWKAVETVEAKK